MVIMKVADFLDGKPVGYLGKYPSPIVCINQLIQFVIYNRVRRISYTAYQSNLKHRKDRFCCSGYYGDPNNCKGRQKF